MNFIEKTEPAFTDEGEIKAPFCKLSPCMWHEGVWTMFCPHMILMEGFGQKMTVTCNPPEGT